MSHSHRRTSRWKVNVQTKRYWVPSLGRMVKLRRSRRAESRPSTSSASTGCAVQDILARGREDLVAQSKDVRPKITLQSTAGTGYRYVTTKNRRNTPERLRIRKYDPKARKHVRFVEVR